MRRYKLFWLLALMTGISLLLIGVVFPLILLLVSAPKSSIGIIGGADIPTAKFVLQLLFAKFQVPIILGLTFIVMSTFCLMFRRTICKHCSIKTTLLSLGISCSCSMGYTGFLNWYFIVLFHEMSRHPIRYPGSIAMGIVALISFLIFTIWYCIAKKKKVTILGVLIDVATILLTFTWFSVLWTGVINIFERLQF